ncbi:MAG: hypothetical protein O3A19_00245 [Planctomycetota bacterium]|nr:hypothetical protein [Planctomycetota bacterium]
MSNMFNMLNLFNLIASLSLVNFLLQAAPPPDFDDAVATPVIVTTLQMDPEKPRSITGWWVTPTGLLEISQDGRYRQWRNHDRFEPPSEIGRWHRQNHAVFWLEAYTLPRKARQRVALSLQDDLLKASLAGEDRTFSKAVAPPRISEDRLLGHWEGPGGTIMFRVDQSYQWIAPERTSIAEVAGQRGHWYLLEDDRLVMEPLVARQTPVITQVILGDDGGIVEFRTSEGPLRRPLVKVARPIPEEGEAKTPNPIPAPTESGKAPAPAIDG